MKEIDSEFEPDSKATENARCLLYLALRNARDGAMFYNKDSKHIVCKINGKWSNIVTEQSLRSYTSAKVCKDVNE